MLAIHYEGWCQIRLATNPDPTDEPRGVSGYSFALPGEPDLDRCIRFHDPVAPRTPGPTVGVFVTEVRLGTEPDAEHPLVGGAVTLLNEAGEPPAHPRDARGPRFEARDYILTDPGHEALWPYHLRVESPDASLRLERKASFGERYDGLPIHRVPHDVMTPFGATMYIAWAEVAAATGITDGVAYRTERRRAVRALYDAAPEGSTERAALGLRLRELALSPNADDDPDGHDRRTLALGGIQTRNFPLTGTASVTDPDDRLGCVAPDAPWPTTFWFGGWDCDALCSYVKGVLLVPLVDG